jgi:hypothetical protein
MVMNHFIAGKFRAKLSHLNNLIQTEFLTEILFRI